jgi:Zn-dependent protease with chaperone function
MLVVALAIVGYRSVLPIAASWVADRVSPELEQRMGEELLDALDTRPFKRSRLEPKRKAEIHTEFATAARAVAPGVRYRLEFRRAGKREINAFALPGGIIVMLDATVAYADAIDRDAVIGVLGHELGHVAHRHSMRGIVQSLGGASLANLLWGDFSSVVATIPFALGQLSHSRAFESDADEHALEVLRARERTARPLYRFFECLQRRPEHKAAGAIPLWLSTHPSNSARMARLRALSGDSDTAAAECPPDPRRKARSR